MPTITIYPTVYRYGFSENWLGTVEGQTIETNSYALAYRVSHNIPVGSIINSATLWWYRTNTIASASYSPSSPIEVYSVSNFDSGNKTTAGFTFRLSNSGSENNNRTAGWHYRDVTVAMQNLVGIPTLNQRCLMQYATGTHLIQSSGSGANSPYITVTYTLPTPAFKVNINGVWKNASDVKVNIDGVWKNATDAWVNINGVWKKS